uniref:SIMPL domain-containing protein n=1 Tax=Thaumasiovibrio occultus TaxID=1891184 RepID=UPI000B34E783|nr:SIMPL domain-containing protein [Thaumasiovibrio occultus]
MKKWLMASVIVLLSPPVWAQSPEFPHVEVQGFGEVQMAPDRAMFSVEVRKTAETAADAKQLADKAVAAFLDRLDKEGVKREQITSANLQLYPEYQTDDNNRREQVGYYASRRITVDMITLDKLNSYLDAALGDGIDAVSQISMKVADDEAFRHQARQLAITDAIEKANSLADGFGMDVDGVWKITYRSASPMPVMRSMALESNAADVSATYQDASLTVDDQVSVIFKLK